MRFPRSVRRSLVALFTLAVLLALPGAARAQTAIGEGSRIIVSADRLVGLFSYVSESYERELPQGGTRTQTTTGPAISLFLGGNQARNNTHNTPRVSLDYKFPTNLTIGGSFMLAVGLGGNEEVTQTGQPTVSTDAPKITVFGLAPRAGYFIPFTETFAFWPRAGLAFYSSSATLTVYRDGQENKDTRSTTRWSLDIDPQFVFTPVPHFGITAGPLVNIPITGTRTDETQTAGGRTAVDEDATFFHFGIMLGLLGYF